VAATQIWLSKNPEKIALAELAIERCRHRTPRAAILGANQVVREVALTVGVVRKSLPARICVVDRELRCVEHLRQASQNIGLADAIGPAKHPNRFTKYDRTEMKWLSTSHGVRNELVGSAGLGKVVLSEVTHKDIRIQSDHERTRWPRAIARSISTSETTLRPRL